jgi:hypothetical protein
MNLPMAQVPVPSYDPEIDGITNSLLQTWGTCREKARLSLKGVTKRSSGLGLTYGGITHWILEHIYEDHRLKRLQLTNGTLSPAYVKKYLTKVEGLWKAENPFPDTGTVQHYELTMMLNELLMPLYFAHWKKKDFEQTEWIGLESEFKIPFEVTRNGISYRTFLRGKRDGMFVDTSRRKKGRWLFETKTKSRIDEETLVDLLPFESQVNLYLVAMMLEFGETPVGVRYNIIRRPSLRQKKSESLKQFAGRMNDDVRKRPSWYFLRQSMVLDPKELDRYYGELEDRVWEFIHWWKGQGGHWKESSNCENKYGVCHFLPICSRKDYMTFFIRDRIFRELAEDGAV